MAEHDAARWARPVKSPFQRTYCGHRAMPEVSRPQGVPVSAEAGLDSTSAGVTTLGAALDITHGTDAAGFAAAVEAGTRSS